MEERGREEGGKEKRRDGGRERNRGQAVKIRRQSGVISYSKDFKNKWADYSGS